ncbi:Dihydroorotase [Luteitalea pratensis]|uniref:Dihydroorotase n=1 Tax=Luteitalea pratensis TaxID=1855912 RepID=A0A143PG07_LUTPR|nr:amidohydrolase/deacetylase family metallohydrolase [Luteitalea pratensis]AMY07183.1 Dihydroorotase [Luteitalea pratensis]
MRRAVLFAALGLLVSPLAAQGPAEYDFLIKGGRVIDPRNSLDAVRDVAIKDGKIAAVATDIAATRAMKAVDARGLVVTPGLIDLHVHVFPGEKLRDYAGGDWSVFPDGFTLRSCVTTVNDAGTSGWRNFPDFKRRVIDESKTRVTAFLNIVGNGMGSGPIEQNADDMDGAATAKMALQHKGVVVGIKSAHYNGTDWKPYEQAVIAGQQADIPVMIDFGGNVKAGRTLMDLFMKYLRPGDIFTHMYGGVRGEFDAATKGPSAAMIEGRKRGIIFDVGHGGTSLRYSAAIPMIQKGFLPDSISTDLHTSSMNSAMKDMLNVMGKFLAMGVPLGDVIGQSTWNPAREIKLESLGHLSVGATADVSVLRVEQGRFGFVDFLGGRLEGTQRLACELTVRDGKVVYDLNGMIADPWDTLPATARGGDPKWDRTRGH